MKNLVQYIQEASRNEKRRNEKFAKNIWINGKETAGIKRFAIFTCENPNSLNPDELSGEERKNALKLNKKNAKELATILKQNHLKFVPVQGKFGGAVENSYMVFNISFEQTKKLSGKYEQTSFFYCYPDDKGDVVSEYWEKENDSEPYSSTKNDYICKETSTAWSKLDKNTKDNYSVIGGDFKYTIDLKLFESVSNDIIKNAKEICEKHNYSSVEEVINESYTKIGQKYGLFRSKLNGY